MVCSYSVGRSSGILFSTSHLAITCSLTVHSPETESLQPVEQRPCRGNHRDRDGKKKINSAQIHSFRNEGIPACLLARKRAFHRQTFNQAGRTWRMIDDEYALLHPGSLYCSALMASCCSSTGILPCIFCGERTLMLRNFYVKQLFQNAYWPSIQTSPSSKNSFFQIGTTFFNVSIA